MPYRNLLLLKPLQSKFGEIAGKARHAALADYVGFSLASLFISLTKMEMRAIRLVTTAHDEIDHKFPIAFGRY